MTPLEQLLPTWSLPLIVAALVLPAVAAGALLGIGAGVALAGALLLALVVLAVRGSEGPIEVAADVPGERNALVVLLAELNPRRDRDRIASTVDHADLHVVVPTQATRLQRWLSATDDATAEAGEVLEQAIQGLEPSSEAWQVGGEVGDPNPVRAVEDALRTHAADEVVFVAEEPDDENAREVARRLDRDVHVLSA